MPWILGWAIALWGAVAQLAFAQPASQPAPQSALQLTWTAPAACPGRGWVLARVARYLGRAVPGDAAAPLSVTAQVEAQGAVFAAHLALASAEGVRQRVLEDADCVLVADAAAFIVALAIDPTVRRQDVPLTDEERSGAGATGGSGAAGDVGGAGAGGDVGGAGESTRGAAAAAGEGDGAASAAGGPDAGAGGDGASSTDDAGPRDDAGEPPEPPGPPLVLGGALGLRIGPAWQPLPDVTAAASLYAALRLGRAWRFELSAGYLFARDDAVPGDPEVAASFDALSASLATCVVGGRAATELGLCLSFAAGLVRGDAAQLSSGRDDSALHAALHLGPLVLHRFSNALALRVEAAPSVALVRPSFHLDTGELVYRAGIIGFSAAVGAEVRFD